MPLYEKRTYQIITGKMPQVLEIEAQMYAVMEAEGFSQNLIGYFTSDTGPFNQVVLGSIPSGLTK